MIEVLPTFVSKSLHQLETASSPFFGTASMLHIDMNDGDFAFPTTWIPDTGEQLPQKGTYEVHLMAKEPRSAGERFIRAGAWRIVGHAEALVGEEGQQTLQGWRAMGAHEVGIALRLETPLSAAEHLSARIDVLQLMSVEKIGEQGQPFAHDVIPRIKEARERFPHAVIAVDGGLDATTIPEVVRAGATRLCVGSAIANATNPITTYKELLSIAENALQ